MPPIKGRGAPTNHTPARFNLPTREADLDWLDDAATIDGPPPKTRTTVAVEHPRTILSRNQSPDIPFDRSINAYRGCEHGCIYCFARPSHAYHDLSPGLDFETKLFAKPDAAKLLRNELAKPSYRPAPIAMGTNTDPYQPIEATYRITRSILEVCLETRHPVTITTKSDRILADLDLLTDLARQNLIAVMISITSLDPHLSRLLEPRAAAPAKRLAAVARLTAAGIPTHINVAPIIPALTDDVIERILAESAAAGAHGAGWILLRLPHEVAPLFRAWLAEHFPDRADKVMNIVREMRAHSLHGPRDNDPNFHTRMRPTGIWADLIRTRFNKAALRLGLKREMAALDCTAFVKPGKHGQMSLF